MMHWLSPICLLFLFGSVFGCATDLNINQIQFVGSHNSYKKAMSDEHREALAGSNPQAALALEYSHIDIRQQLDLGIRKLELDVFYQPAKQRFLVGHVQVIDMNSHCETLKSCLAQIVDWSARNSSHVPLWISFNAKDQKIPGLPDPNPFDEVGFRLLDQIVTEALGSKLLWPKEVKSRSGELQWPSLSAGSGKILLILDEGGEKRDIYARNWRERPLFVNVEPSHPAAAIMIINDPVENLELIQARVKAGFMVRTRADADTIEARNNDTRRRERAFASGAQAISTDYYQPATHFGNDYQVLIPKKVRCNPVLTSTNCRLGAHSDRQ